MGKRVRTDEVEFRQENVPVARFQEFARPSLRGRGRPSPEAKPESLFLRQRCRRAPPGALFRAMGERVRTDEVEFRQENVPLSSIDIDNAGILRKFLRDMI